MISGRLMFGEIALHSDSSRFKELILESQPILVNNNVLIFERKRTG
jgi:hypothetical protein